MYGVDGVKIPLSLRRAEEIYSGPEDQKRKLLVDLGMDAEQVKGWDRAKLNVFVLGHTGCIDRMFGSEGRERG